MFWKLHKKLDHIIELLAELEDRQYHNDKDIYDAIVKKKKKKCK